MKLFFFLWVPQGLLSILSFHKYLENDRLGHLLRFETVWRARIASVILSMGDIIL